jgi:hypothetical protein
MYTLFIYYLEQVKENGACITGVKSIASPRKTVALGHISCDNSYPLGGKVALYSLEAHVTEVN